ncbi:MAG TPA: dTDP-4-dehydrorhamnose 3,5-epimerase [Polyangiaceae bacterium]
MEVTALPLAGLLLLKPKVFRDARGFFVETYNQVRYREAGVAPEFVQDNHSLSGQGTLRGLHYQSSPGQAKLIRVARGRIFDVAVDIRPDSPTFGRWHGVYLDAEEHLQLFVPVGFAHGFCIVSESAEVLYKVSNVYDPKTETGFRWNDPDVGVEWPIGEPLLSKRDQEAESFAEYAKRVRKS